MKKTALLLTAISSSAFLLSAQAQETLVLSTWGYDEDKLQEVVYKPFSKKYDVKIVLEKGNNGSRLGKIRQRGGETVDIIQLSASYMVQAQKAGLLDSNLNTNNVPNLDKLYSFAKNPIGKNDAVADTIVNVGIAYNSETVKPIQEWSDLWRSDLKDKVSIGDISTSGGPMNVLFTADIIKADAYKETDAVFAKLKELKPNLRKTYKRSSEVVNLFTQNEIDAAVLFSFAYPRIAAANPAVKFVTPNSGGYATTNLISVSKNSKKKDLAYKFINYLLSADVQKKLAQNIKIAPTNKDVVLTNEEAKGISYGKEFVSKLRFVDQVKAVEKQKEWTQAWRQQILTK